MEKKLILGIDAGATKTTAAIGDATSTINIGQAGPANIHTTSPSEIKQHISDAIKQALNDKRLPAKIIFDHIVIGMAGIDSAVDYTKAHAIVIKVIKPWYKPNLTTLTLINDIFIVRRSGSDSPFGLALIAGTGAHGLGVNQHGETIHAGGLEYLLSDEGSSYDMGIKALRAAIRSEDGRDRKTQLEEAVLSYFQITSTRQLEPLIYHQTYFNKALIGQVAQLVDITARHGDWRAKEIINETIAELLLYVKAMVNRLHMKNDAFDLVVIGGVFNISGVSFLKRFKMGVHSIAKHARVIVPNYPAVIGAIKIAQDKLKN